MAESTSARNERSGRPLVSLEGPKSAFVRKLAGLTPVGRILRQLDRAGVDAVEIRCLDCDGDDIPGRWQRETPRGLGVTVVRNEGEGTRGAEWMRADALYSSSELQAWVESGCQGLPSSMLVLETEEDWHRADNRLWQGANKSLEHDGVVAYFVGRPLARLFSRLLVGTAVTPNQVTAVSLLVGLVGAVAAAWGTYWGFVLGAFLYWFGMVVDCVDGDLARVRVEGSRLGQWLDSVADDISTATFTAGMGLGLARFGADMPWSWIGGDAQWWGWAGVVGGIAVLLAQTHVYRGLVRAGLPIDTAKYPWFFLGEQGVVRSKPGLGTYLGHAVRRDFSSAAYTVLCLVGLVEIVGLACIIGGLVVFVLALVDALVKAGRAGGPAGTGD